MVDEDLTPWRNRQSGQVGPGGSSKLDWTTIVRPVGLSNAKVPQHIQESLNNQPKPSLTISRGDLAAYLLDSPEKGSLIGEKVVVSKK